MPLFNGADTLKYMCLKKVYAQLIARTSDVDEENYKYRLLLIEHLPGSIRSDLFCYGFPESETDLKQYLSSGRDSLFGWLPLTTYLFDSRITNVPAVCICEVQTDLPLMMTFISFLWVHRPKITSLRFVLLSTNVCYEKRNKNIMMFAINILSKHFDEGLATRLVHLQLTHQCNDSIFKAIGQHAKCLKKLDVSFSFNVTIDGVKELVFKNIDQLRRLMNGLDEKQYCYLLKLMVRKRDMFNTACFTLEDLDLTYTKINNTGMVTVLSCINNLKYLSWPRCRPVMKTISTAWYEILKPNSLHMQLLSVSERNINRCNHLYTIAESMPCLKEFDTSLTWSFELLSNVNHIGQKLMEFWNRLYSLTIYMKTSMVLSFHQFLETSLLRNLSELTIKSCPYLEFDAILDLAKLQRYCPNLIMLDVVSTLTNFDRAPTGKFHRLKSLTIRSPSNDTKTWFLNGGCPALEEFKVYHEIDPDYWTNLFLDPLPLVRNQLQILRIVFDTEGDFVIPNYSSILTTFIEKCSILKVFGNIFTFCISTEDKDTVRDFVRMRNYSLTLC